MREFQAKRSGFFNITSLISAIGLITLVCLYGCSSTPKIPPPVLGQSPLGDAPIATQTPIVTPTPPLVGGVTFVPLERYTTKAEREFIEKVSVVMNDVGYSQCTGDFLAKRKMIQTNGKSALEVVQHLMSLKGKVNVGFYVSKNPWSSARAYRDGDNIWLNRRHIGVTSDLCETAATFDHEGRGHALGLYDHDFEWSASREYSVPYSIDHAYAAEPYSQSPSGGCCK